MRCTEQNFHFQTYLCPNWQLYSFLTNFVGQIAFLKVVIALSLPCKSLHVCSGPCWYCIAHSNGTLPRLVGLSSNLHTWLTWDNSLRQIHQHSSSTDATSTNRCIVSWQDMQNLPHLQNHIFLGRSIQEVVMCSYNLGMNTIWSVIIGLACKWY